MAAGDFIELDAHYNGVYIFLSYLVSFVGAWTTLEMLLKRTGTRGWWNVMLLLGAGIAFGSTATFGMHFVGNQAVTLHFPPPWQGAGVPLSYNAGFTILSLVVSCVSMIIAFSFIGLRFDLPGWRSRLADVEQGSSAEKSDDTAYDDEYGTDGIDKKDAEFATGAAFDPDVKADSPEDGRQTRFNLPPGRKMPLSSTFDIALPKRHNKVAEEKKRAVEDEDEETEDGGDFGVGGVRLSGSGVAKILLAGIVCGGGIAAMHYVGQVSIDSVPLVTNSWYTVLLSVIIAMLCVTVGLYILFVIFRPKLQHSWYKRVIVAGILAIGVTLMHFVALLGTHYWARQGEALKAGSDNTTKMIIIAIICVVAPICCILLLVFAYFGQLRLLRQRASRHRVILGTAIFDQNGLLLVHPESGLLPSARIYPNKPGEQEKVSLFQLLGTGNRLRLEASKLKLQRSDPAFVAFVKMSWSWRSQRGSAAAPGAHGGNSSGDGSQGERAADDESDPSMRLSEAEEMTGSEAEMLRRSVLSFEMASEEIASEVTGAPDLKALGVLFDSILKIGHYQVSSKSSGDQFTVTQGQMLVLARRLKNNAEREALVARGFVFAEPGAVARVTANAYAVPYERVFEYFRDVYRFTRFGINKRLDRGRLYGGLLMLQALPGEGLNIVVEERQHHSLPMVELATLVDPIADRSRFAATNLAVTTVDSVVNAMRQIGDQSLLELVNTPTATTGYDPSAQLRSLLVGTLRPYLERSLGLEVVNFILPRLHIIPTVVPLTARPGATYGTDGLAKNAYLVCLKAIIPSSVTLPGAKLNWLPFPLYQAQAECVARASGTDAGSARPNTGGSIVEAARFGGSSSPSDKNGGRKGSVAESSEADFPFPTATSAPFVSSAFPSALSAAKDHPLAAGSAGGAGKRLSVYSQGSAHENEEDRDSFQPLPQPGASTSEMPRGVPAYSPDWIVGLVRSSVSQPTRTHHQWDWDVPSRPRMTPRNSTT
ncbi:MHYT domain signaling protein [Rhodotorula toruloides]|uniref:MHYT domain signaling protein n=1 Tax=Rhodotorula toruloides TaxID=5286 RepID=A0A511KHS0_RHOTO|nr:MHYT domain signaling protein [Rhodotorula toruloides]